MQVSQESGGDPCTTLTVDDDRLAAEIALVFELGPYACEIEGPVSWIGSPARYHLTLRGALQPRSCGALAPTRELPACQLARSEIRPSSVGSSREIAIVKPLVRTERGNRSP